MTEIISSRHNPRVKLAAKLRDRRGRREQRRIIIDGIREIQRALDADVEFIEAFVCDELLEESGHRLQQGLSRAGCDFASVTPSVLEKLVFGDRSDGIIAVAKPPVLQLNDLTVHAEMLVAVLENVEKPGNVGAVIRSADASGVSAVIVADAGTDLYNPNSIRASAGTIFSMPLVACSSDEALSWLRQHAFRIFATRVDGAIDYTSAYYADRIAFILGSEADGLSDLWKGEAVESILLPMRGVGDSLNVSVTAAILFYEALRQRELRSRQSGV
ncbi:MAG: RNA methyltransferase [Planctomycetaceae bacterium]|nr:RNA methyltransferase [Planctomycetales bacterium]MCB9923148.1 RNA methyltransferase [Planctomycetaceae bacterium]